MSASAAGIGFAKADRRNEINFLQLFSRHLAGGLRRGSIKLASQ